MAVSIPYRYDKNAYDLGSFFIVRVFQFLIGTIKTQQNLAYIRT